ncbi:MAG: oligosaccharyl transferase, archaeosortase A system-associated [Methanosarcinaceae archaeon]|nr:oligosaccharyl transferase, archaeosortase A system-associated [Methanosarcinaceae archaeon]
MTGENKKSKIINALPYCVGVIISFLIAFYIRTIPKAGVFLSNGFVRFGGNDPWYHLRNVESILHNYPHMLWFDAYTTYPSGTRQVFAPLYDMLLATIIWIIGLGKPSQDLINTVCAYYPAVLGALVVIPTYFAARWVFDRRVGLFAAFIIAISPGQFLSRTMIGFNDHHVAETLFSTIIAMFLIMTLKIAREHPITFENLKTRNFDALKPALPYLILTGISLGAYSLAWYGAVFFSLIIGIYFTVQHIIDHMHKRPTDYLAVSGAMIFFIALLMVLAVPNLSSKGLLIKGLLAGIIAFPLLTLISIEINKRKLEKYYYPLSIVALSIAVIILAKVFSPSAYALIASLASYFIRTGGGTTIAEASPLLYQGGVFTLKPLWYNFGPAVYIAFLALLMLTYEVITKKNTQEKTFLLVWTVMIIWATLQQNRFAYYLSINIAILAGYLGIRLLEFGDWNTFIPNFKSKIRSTADLPEFVKVINIKHILSALLVFLILINPTYTLAMQQSQGVGGPGGQWLEAVGWMRYNTPDPGISYYENYPIPPAGERFQYPDTAYGVMSWWDYGHWIEVIGHRIPNANPFQSGIGGRRNSLDEVNQPGASTFFTAPSEEEATAVLEAVHPDPDKAGARYIVSDVEMATGKFYAMTAWTLDTANYYIPVQTSQGTQNVPGPRYFESMEARLHIFDGNGLKQYRLVHESPAGYSAEVGYKSIYNQLFGGSIPETNTGYVKIFEYVKGATIKGTAPENETVTISATIRTGLGRTFEYTQATPGGAYEFTVPYSTEGPIPGQTQFDTRPIAPYTVSYGNTTTEVRVSEMDVLDGNTIIVN